MTIHKNKKSVLVLEGDYIQMSKLVSIVVPCYNEEQAIPYYCKEIKKQILVLTEKFSNVDYEVIFVDDGSDDGTLECIKRMEMQNVQYISFSRNFGKEAALYAGFIKSKGDFVVTMDVKVMILRLQEELIVLVNRQFVLFLRVCFIN